MPNCKYCQAEIIWSKIGDKNIPTNKDGSNHRCIANKPNNSTLEHSAFNDSEIISALARLIRGELQK